MKTNGENNYAFIDGQNLNAGVKALGWKLDHRKFREFLRQKFSVNRAYMFLGFMEEHQDLYNALQESGFVLVFKPLVRYDDGPPKGNVDADMVLQAMIDKDHYDKAVIVTGDGDFAGLIRYLDGVGKLKQVIVPNKDRYSSLFDRLESFKMDKVTFMNDLKSQLSYRTNGRKRTKRR